MYSEENDEEQEEQASGNFFVNFYYNNKVLVWIFIGIIVFILLMSLLTKGKGGSSSSGYTVEILPNNDIVVSKGRSTNLSAQIKNKPDAQFTWSVEDETVVKVDQGGTVTGISYGKTDVYATFINPVDQEKYTATKSVTVADGDASVKLTDVSFREGDLFMPLNDTYNISLVLTPSNGYIESEKFTSSDTSVVTVNNSGMVTSVGEGSAIITLEVNDGQFRKELNVYVDRDCTSPEIVITPERIAFDGELRKIKVGSVENLSYTVEPRNTDLDKLIWKSSDDSVLTVSNGQVKGISQGVAVVTVSSLNGREAKIDIEVESDIIEVTDISLPISTIYLTVGQSQTITPIISPDNASNKALSYTPMDSSIVYVSPNGTGTQATINAIRAGTTSISVKSVSLSNPVEKIINVVVTGSSSGGGNSGSGNSGGGSGSGTIVVRVNGDSPTKSCDGQELKYYNNPTVKITLNSGVSKVVYCYGTSKCTPNTTITSTSSFTIAGKGLYTLRLKKYDSSGNEIASSESGNYNDGALEYFINTQGEGTKCVGGSSNVTSNSVQYTITPLAYDTQTTASGNSYNAISKITIKLKDSSTGYITYCIRLNTSNSCLKEGTLRSGSVEYKPTSEGLYVIIIKRYQTGSTSGIEDRKYISMGSRGSSGKFNCNGLDVTSCNSGQATSYCSWCSNEGVCKEKGTCNCSSGLLLRYRETCKVPSGQVCHFNNKEWLSDKVECKESNGCGSVNCKDVSTQAPATQVPTTAPTATPKPTVTVTPTPTATAKAASPSPTPLSECCYLDSSGKYTYTKNSSLCAQYGGFRTTETNCDLLNDSST